MLIDKRRKNNLERV